MNQFTSWEAFDHGKWQGRQTSTRGTTSTTRADARGGELDPVQEPRLLHQDERARHRRRHRHPVVYRPERTGLHSKLKATLSVWDNGYVSDLEW